LTRRGDDRLDTVSGSQPGHQRSFVPTAGAVVDFGDEMAMDIHQRLGETHGCIQEGRGAGWQVRQSAGQRLLAAARRQ
jgi:hypothetical protein